MEFTNTIPRTITQITTQICDPSGKSSILSPNSACIYKIVKANNTNLNEDQLWEHLNNVNEDDKITKLNHYVWQRYASSVWDDIRIKNVLPFKDSREEDDEKHVHPLQLDVIDRIVELYSNPNEVVLTPFMGVGSEVYSPVSMGRKAIGIELKDSYYKQAILNVEEANRRFKEKAEQTTLF